MGRCRLSPVVVCHSCRLFFLHSVIFCLNRYGFCQLSYPEPSLLDAICSAVCDFPSSAVYSVTPVSAKIFCLICLRLFHSHIMSFCYLLQLYHAVSFISYCVSPRVICLSLCFCLLLPLLPVLLKLSSVHRDALFPSVFISPGLFQVAAVCKKRSIN